jgi:hypothetical protein
MPKNGTRAEVNTFVKGLISEASPLNFPANASYDEVNFELHRDGSRSRRLGMDREVGGVLEACYTALPSALTGQFNTFVWKSVGGNPLKEFLVVQVADDLFFYDNKQAILSTSGSLFQHTLSLANDKDYSLSVVDGKLVIVSGHYLIDVLTYDELANTLTHSTGALFVRDLWGVEETHALTETDPLYRPTGTITDTHAYNLLNQSWAVPRKDKTGTLVNPITQYESDLSVFPSNSEEVWAGLQYQPVVGAADPYERLYTNLYDERLGADSTVSRGAFIINFLNRGVSRYDAYISNRYKYPLMDYGSLTLTYDLTTKGATVATEFAGRMWYAGFNGVASNADKRSPVISNYILFSQLVKSKPDIFNCYQAGDPTSREGNEIVDTDGGTIRIAGAQNIITLSNIGSHLLVFAANGIWSISGGSDYGFTATNYKVEKLSSYGCISPSSVVEAGGTIAFWSEDGIFSVGKNQYGALTVTSLTEATIQTRYDSWTLAAKGSAKGFFNSVDKKISWIVKEGTRFSSAIVTKELTLDLSLGAFSENVISNSGSAVELFSGFITYSATSPVVKYLFIDKSVTDVITFGFSEYKDASFRDWKFKDTVGVDAKAFLLTGAITAGDSAVAKQTPYLTMHFTNTERTTDSEGVPVEQSSCFIRTQWDWAVTADPNKWSSLKQAYRKRQVEFTIPNDLSAYSGLLTTVSKSKLRGKGKAFSLYMETEPYRDCKILGWVVTLNGNANT